MHIYYQIHRENQVADSFILQLLLLVVYANDVSFVGHTPQIHIFMNIEAMFRGEMTDLEMGPNHSCCRFRCHYTRRELRRCFR
jgi:hypothetical protein